MPAPGEEHSLYGSVSVLSCAPPRPGSLSVCMTMIVCMKPPAVWLYVCLYPALTSLNSVVTAWSPGAPADREARDWHPRPGISPKFSAPRSRGGSTCGTASAPTGAAAGARPGLSERCVYTTTRRLPRHAAHAPPRRTHSCPIAARAAWGPVGGGTAPRRRRKPPSAVTRVSATRPSRYVRVPASARAPWGLSVGWGRWPLPLAPGTRRAKRRTWHPSIHNFALSGKSSQSQVSTCSGRARAPPARARGAWPFMAILCHPFLCHSLFRRNANM